MLRFFIFPSFQFLPSISNFIITVFLIIRQATTFWHEIVLVSHSSPCLSIALLLITLIVVISIYVTITFIYFEIREFISFGLNDFRIIVLQVPGIIIGLFLLIMPAFGLGGVIRFGFFLVIPTFVGLIILFFFFIITYFHIFGSCFFVITANCVAYFSILAIFAELHSSLLLVLIFVRLNYLLHLAIEIFAVHQLVHLKQIKLPTELFSFSNPIFISEFFQHSL